LEMPRDRPDGTWRESWLPADAEPEPAEPCRVAPCSVFRICVSPMFGLVMGIVAINYGPYVLWLPHETLLAKASIAVFHVLVAFLVASYVMCVFTDPGTTPVEWHRLVERDERLASEFNFCRKSSMYRPLRSHFCSVTRRVVLNMDHFCPWVINTVGFYNRKFFILFLLYTLGATSWVLLSNAPLLIRLYTMPGAARQLERQWGPQRYMFALMATLIDGALCIMLACFCPFHIRMALLNETTIEGPSPMFDVGYRRNWQQVFGRDPVLWFLPVYGGGPDGDGVHWPSGHVKSPEVPAGFRAQPSGAHELEEGRLLARESCSDSSVDDG